MITSFKNTFHSAIFLEKKFEVYSTATDLAKFLSGDDLISRTTAFIKGVS